LLNLNEFCSDLEELEESKPNGVTINDFLKHYEQKPIWNVDQF
jgi:hypothetical protein